MAFFCWGEIVADYALRLLCSNTMRKPSAGTYLDYFIIEEIYIFTTTEILAT